MSLLVSKPTIILLKPMFLVYVTIVFSFGSTIDSSTMHTNFALKNLSPHFGTRFVLVNNRLECNFPSLVTLRQSVSSVRTCELNIILKDDERSFFADMYYALSGLFTYMDSDIFARKLAQLGPTNN